MKQFPIIFIFLLIVGCNKQEVLITIDLPDQPEVNLIYTVPISGTIFWGFSDTLKANGTGKSELNLKITQPSFITIRNENVQNRVKMLIEPGCDYHVVMDTLKNIQITGANEKGQMLYTTLPNPEYIDMEIRKIVNPRNDTASLVSVQQKINDLKQSDLSKFKELLDGGEITKSFFDLIQKDRDCYYASMEATFLLQKTYEPVRLGIKIGDDLLQNLKKIYEQYPPNDERFLFSSFWTEYADSYIKDYNQFIREDFDLQKFMELRNSGAFNTYIINESKKYLSGKALEFFQARYIYYECFQSSYKGSLEKEFISLLEQFEKDYPQSEYLKYIRPFIDKIIDYYRIIEQPFDKDVLFLENYETFNTLEEAVKPLLGKKIYIDVWATWCGPCKVEFAHNEALKKILAENDIQLLYISIDRDDHDQNWKNEIKYHKLTGTHIRANSELQYNLMKRFDKKAESPYIAIPWYILVDEKGNITEEHAKSPSQLVSGEQLFANF